MGDAMVFKDAIRITSIKGLIITFAVVMPFCADATDNKTALEDTYFEAVFQDPTNLLMNFRLAGAQLDNGNIKGAIGTLERVLVLSPNNNQAQFLIGMAHLQIGNRAESQRMLTLLLDNPDASDAEREKAQAVLAGLKQQQRPFKVSGVFSFGRGVFDNPAGGSVGNLSQVNGNIITNSNSFSKRDTTEEFNTASMQINLNHKLESQYDENLIFSLSASGRDFINYDDGDSVNLGVSTRYLRGFENAFGPASVNAGVSLSRVDVSSRHYLSNYGTSLTASQIFNNRWNAALSLGLNRLIFQKSFSANTGLKTAVNKSGGVQIARLFKTLQLGGRYNYVSSDAKADYNSKQIQSAGVFASTNILPGLISAGVDFTKTQHEAPELIYGNEARQDRTRSIRLSYLFGLESFGTPIGNEGRINIVGRYGKTKSNIVNFTKNSAEVSVNFIKPF